MKLTAEYLRWWFVGGLLLAGCGAVNAQLDSALKVRSLDSTRAESGMEVDLTATVIFADPPSTIFVQDELAGTFFRLDGRPPPKPGDEVRVRGKTMPGLYLPGIEEADFEVTGHPGLPGARPVGFADLMSGRYHYQRVVVEGVVRSLVPEDEAGSTMRVATGTEVLEVRLDVPPKGAVENWIDARVRVTGLAAGDINHRRQLVEPYLRCAAWGDVDLLETARSPENVPLISADKLLTFQVAGREQRRVKVSGLVLARFDDGRIFLRDGEAAIEVALSGAVHEVEVGDLVEIAGFPEMERFSASVVDSELLNREAGPGEVVPIAAAIADLMSGDFDGDLVSVRGRLADWYRVGQEKLGVAVLRDGDAVLQVKTPLPKEEGDWVAGMELRVAGICLVESRRRTQYRSLPEAVSLRVRSAGDVMVLGKPGWWTPGRLAVATVGLLGVMVLAGLWILLLRRQVSRQTVALRGRIENEAALEERQRIAREFHDTLEQDLAGLSLRLDAASARGKDEKLKGFLEGSRSLVSRIQTETRNLVADLRMPSGSLADPGEALAELVQQPEGNVGAGIGLELDDGLPLLPSHIVHHLRMMAQEAVTNARKHSSAVMIRINLANVEDGLELRITDDGEGFDVEQETMGKSGHFGCMGMRERARKIGADVRWQSGQGEGTVVTVNYPLVVEDGEEDS